MRIAAATNDAAPMYPPSDRMLADVCRHKLRSALVHVCSFKLFSGKIVDRNYMEAADDTAVVNKKYIAITCVCCVFIFPHAFHHQIPS